MPTLIGWISANRILTSSSNNLGYFTCSSINDNQKCSLYTVRYGLNIAGQTKKIGSIIWNFQYTTYKLYTLYAVYDILYNMPNMNCWYGPYRIIWSVWLCSQCWCYFARMWISMNLCSLIKSNSVFSVVNLPDLLVASLRLLNPASKRLSNLILKYNFKKTHFSIYD